jgi:hypothetical protein
MPPSFLIRSDVQLLVHTKGGASEPEVQAAGACYSQNQMKIHIANRAVVSTRLWELAVLPLRLDAILFVTGLAGHDFWTPVDLR